MKRDRSLDALANDKIWDVVVIGGGATGLGVAFDAVTRGLSTVLVEARDFASATSSRSTKLIHGGVRYLAQGNLRLVREALVERGRLIDNAPHLCKTQAFVIPCETWGRRAYYRSGLWLYDCLAKKPSIGSTRSLSAAQAERRLAGVKAGKRIAGGVVYYDGQFDDARLAITLAESIVDRGGTVLNYFPVTALCKDNAGKIAGVHCHDTPSGQSYAIKGKCVVNATGVFADTLIAMDEPGAKPRLVPSQGVHLVLDRAFLPGNDALMVPKTRDGRVLFAVPWHDKLIVGTTDTPVKSIEYDPKPREEEIAFILDTARDYLSRSPTRADVKSVFVGLRPLAVPAGQGKATREISRSHKVEIAPSGLVHIFGGKWTTYRQMAEDTMDAAARAGLLAKNPCVTADLRLHGYVADNAHLNGTPLAPYGGDAAAIAAMAAADSTLAAKIHPNYPYTYAQIAWALDKEMAETLEDVLARRIRLLFLDAVAARESAPAVAEFIAAERQWDEARKAREMKEFRILTEQYTLSI